MFDLRAALPPLLALVAGLYSAGANANLVQNGSFEAPTISGNYAAGIPPGWSSLGNGSSTDVLAAGYSGGSASDGSQYLDLIGNNQGVFPSGLSQNVHLIAGRSYRLAFDYTGGRYSDGSKTSGAVLEYTLGNLSTGAFNVDDLNNFPDFGPKTAWQHFSADISVAVSGDYALTFQTPSGAWGSPYLDRVSMEALPEPASWLLLGLGTLVSLVTRKPRARIRS
ncbi:MAG: PEP-CTERM sorting domain-containing protein [Rhodocyclaceae bacterium]|nr:PEP-CTERM sorting domain-containing protein [Rhodocyclaceae bacterium]